MKAHFVETVTIPWTDTVTITPNDGTYIKNIRMVQQDGVLTYIDIRLNGELHEHIFVPALPLYRYIYNIKKKEHIPFYLNAHGIKDIITIEAHALNETTTVKGNLRYDVYDNDYHYPE